MDKKILSGSVVAFFVLFSISLISAVSVLAVIPTPPAGYSTTPIVQVTYPVSNVLDTGYMPLPTSPWRFWALDSYMETLIIWPATTAPAGTYAVYTISTGTWCTFAGALSPNGGIPEPYNGCGTKSESDSGILTPGVPFDSSAQATGTLGAIDCGGTKAMIVINGVQVDNPTVPGGGPCDTVLPYFFPGITQTTVNNFWNAESYSGIEKDPNTGMVTTYSSSAPSTGDIITAARPIPAPSMSPYLMVLLVGSMAVIGMAGIKRKV